MWPEDRLYQLIEEYRKREILWKNEYCRNTNVWERNDAWEKIASVMNSSNSKYFNYPVSVNQCRNRIYMMRVIYNNRRKEIKRNIELGKDPDETELDGGQKVWCRMTTKQIYEALNFLTYNELKQVYTKKKVTNDAAAAIKDKDGASSSNMNAENNDACISNVNVVVGNYVDTSDTKTTEDFDASSTSVHVKVEDDLTTSNFTIEEEFDASNINLNIKEEDEGSGSSVVEHKNNEETPKALSVEENPEGKTLLPTQKPLNVSIEYGSTNDTTPEATEIIPRKPSPDGSLEENIPSKKRKLNVPIKYGNKKALEARAKKPKTIWNSLGNTNFESTRPREEHLDGAVEANDEAPESTSVFLGSIPGRSTNSFPRDICASGSGCNVCVM